jgi:hypothetical protein
VLTREPNRGHATLRDGAKKLVPIEPMTGLELLLGMLVHAAAQSIPADKQLRR